VVFLTIYTVKRGDTLYSIARRYGTTVSQITYDNQIDNPEGLVVGQALVVGTGTNTHTVARGESLYSIARNYGTTVNALLAANPSITNPSRIYPGQIIVISNNEGNMRRIDVNGFSVNMNSTAIDETLAYLTYISPFSYAVSSAGALTPLSDDALIAKARAQSVAPLMCITNTNANGGFSSEIAHSVLTNQSAQDTLIENIITTLRENNYYGLVIDFEYVYPFDKESYNQFLRKISSRLHSLGYILVSCVAPKTSATQSGTLYEAHDYPVHGEVCDLVIIMTYEWGYTYGPAMAVAPIGPVRRVLDYAVTAIPSGKILMGMPNYGYNWTLPFVQGSAATVVSNTGAVNTARNMKAEIQYDSVQQAPYINYYDAEGRQHEIWFDDARSIQARLRLVDEYNLGGISYWTINRLFRQGLLVLQDMYIINKVL
jgi:spore germination protein